MTLTFHLKGHGHFPYKMDENIIFFVENVSFFIYLYNIKWMNKTYNQLKVKRS